MLLLLAAAALAAPEYRVDLSSTVATHEILPMRANARRLCLHHEGPVGAAAVFYSKAGGFSSWGHASIRMLVCEDRWLHDLEYEAYRFGPAARERLAEMYEERPSFLDDEDYLRSQRASMIFYRNEEVLDRGYYAEAQGRNREVYELWLDLDPPSLQALYGGLEKRVQAQHASLEAREDLRPRYQPVGHNCTWHLREELPSVVPGAAVGHRVFPHAIQRDLWRNDVVDFAVFYPSHAVVRRWDRRGEWPERVGRLRPVLRGSRVLPEGLEQVLRARRGSPVAVELHAHDRDAVAAP
jgi:hypothetical protein